MKIEIEIPSKIEQNGNTYVPTGEYNHAVPGEHYFDINTRQIHSSYGCAQTHTCLKYPIYKLSPWRAEFRGDYHMINSVGEVKCMCDGCDVFDDNRYRIGNYFKTYEEAKIMSDKFKTLLTDGEVAL